MRSLKSRLEVLEAKHGNEPLMFILRDMISETCDGESIGELVGYDSVSGEVIARRVDGETDKALLARAKSACSGNPIVLQTVRARSEALPV